MKALSPLGGFYRSSASQQHARNKTRVFVFDLRPLWQAHPQRMGSKGNPARSGCTMMVQRTIHPGTNPQML
jgi:hypothetical protein